VNDLGRSSIDRFACSVDFYWKRIGDSSIFYAFFVKRMSDDTLGHHQDNLYADLRHILQWGLAG